MIHRLSGLHAGRRGARDFLLACSLGLALVWVCMMSGLVSGRVPTPDLEEEGEGEGESSRLTMISVEWR